MSWNETLDGFLSGVGNKLTAMAIVQRNFERVWGTSSSGFTLSPDEQKEIRIFCQPGDATGTVAKEIDDKTSITLAGKKYIKLKVDYNFGEPIVSFMKGKDCVVLVTVERVVIVAFYEAPFTVSDAIDVVNEYVNPQFREIFGLS